MRGLEEKIDQLLEAFFPWGREGLPCKPPTAEGRRRVVALWLDDQTGGLRPLVLALMSRVLAVLREVERPILEQEGKRLVARVDTSALLKTPESILDKMVRGCAGLPEDQVSFLRLFQEMDDLGRFRIVTNFLSDAESVAAALSRPHQRRLHLRRTADPLRAAQLQLADEFVLLGEGFGETVHSSPRKGGSRSWKAHFSPRDWPERVIEVQIQTQLQEAWDKKDHYLIYEPRRAGHEVCSRHLCEMAAMSELLYIADLTFDRLRGSVLHSRQRGG